MKLAKQEQKVFNYIRDKRGCTTRDIQRDLLIECPSARITGLRSKGVAVRTNRPEEISGFPAVRDVCGQRHQAALRLRV